MSNNIITKPVTGIYINTLPLIELYLHTPSYEELWYRQKIMQDSDTMSYNKGYDLDFEGYDKATGCLAFPEQKWADWYTYFNGQEPQRFYAYVNSRIPFSFRYIVNPTDKCVCIAAIRSSSKSL